MKPLLTFHLRNTKSSKHTVFTSLIGSFIILCLHICLFLPARVLQAQPTLVKDINDTPTTSTFQPERLIQINGIVYFSAEDPENGRELWRSDGTEQGTYVVKDINPGTGSSSPTNLTNVNGTLYFAANKKEVQDVGFIYHGSYEIWKTDGTLAGTVKVREVSLGSKNPESPEGGLVPIVLYGFNNTLIFSSGYNASNYSLYANNPNGAEKLHTIEPDHYLDLVPSFLVVNNTLYFTTIARLWKTNGTATGTVLVKEINAIENYNTAIASLTNVNGTLYFKAYSSANGSELWKSDGTTAGTVMVKDIVAGAGGSFPQHLTNMNGTLYFSADNGTSGAELWKTDGTAQGTVLVKDIVAGTGSSSPTKLTNVNGTLYFLVRNAGTNALWKSNGTAATTQLVKTILSDEYSYSYYYATLYDFTNVKGTLFFLSRESYTRLWKSNGTTDGTVEIQKTLPPSSLSSIPQHLTNVNGTMYFSADNGTSGRELWKSDGTAEETVLVKDIAAGTGSSSPGELTNINGTLYFSADNGSNGSELWKSDGTTAGTVMVKDIAAGTGSSSPAGFTNINGTLYFSADNGTSGAELWKTDGTAQGTVLVKDIVAGTGSSSPKNLLNVNGTLFFTVSNATGYSLWKSNGTAAGTVMVKDGFYTPTGYPPYRPSDLNSVNGTIYITINGILYFSAYTTANGMELWKSDGTAEGTVMVKEIIAGTGSSSPDNLTNLNGTLYFSASNGSRNGRDLWKSDGTAAGTVIVKSINNHIERIINVNGKLNFFTVIGSPNRYYNINVGVGLWTSNGTAEGTVLLKDDFTENVFDIYDVHIDAVAVGNTLLFRANNNRLWRSNGTAAGTVLVSNINVVSGGGFYPVAFASTGSTAYFGAFESKAGIELWKYNPSACHPPTETNLEVVGNSTCAGKNGLIIIKGSESGLSYQALVNNAAVSAPVSGNGSDITLTIPAIRLSVGENKFTIQASGCYVDTLTSTASITISETCQQGISVASLTLINADTDQDIKTIANGEVIDYASLGTKNITIRANTSPATVGSVVFTLDGRVVRTENVAPYALGGDVHPSNPVNYYAYPLAVGSYSLKATPYSARSAGGTAGEALTVSFTVVEGPTVLSLTLINADTDKDIREIKSGEIIDYSKLGTKNINIRANTYPVTVGSVVFNLNGRVVRTENVAPYALGGDVHPSSPVNYYAYPLAAGSYSLKASPYSARSAGGTAGTALTVSFTVTNGTTARLGQEATQAGISVHPNPFQDRVILQAAEGSGKVRIEVVDALGKLQHKAEIKLQSGKAEVALPAGLPAGAYFMLVVAEGKDPQVVKLLKQ